MSEDSQLLQRYSEDGDEDAFREIVQRRVDLVYSVALRHVNGDAHLAADVTQSVFTDLARKSRSLMHHPTLSGWLHRSAHFAAHSAIRAEQRRRLREQEAKAMQEIPLDKSSPENIDVLRPILDDALSELSDRDRDAVALRFFESQTFADVATRLRLGEDAARMRVDRALEKLRRILARRGVTSTSGALALALANQINAASPAGIASAIAAKAVAAVAIGSGAASTLAFMTITKTHLILATAVAVAGVGTIFVQHRTNTHLQREIESLQSENADAKRLREENQQLARTAATVAPSPDEHAELLRTRAALNEAQRKLTEAEKPKSALPSGAIGATAENGLRPIDSIGNAGLATPRAAFETQLWAASRGDVEIEAKAITFTPETRAKLETFLASLPEDLRKQFGTPERLMATVLAGSPHPVGGMQILSESPQSDGAVVLGTKWQHADDDIVHQSDVTIVRGGDGWQMVVPMTLVDRGIAYLSRKTGAQPTP